MKILEKQSSWSGPLVVVALVSALALAMGCDPEIEQRGPSVDRTSPVFDPATSTIPLPNDMAMTPDGRLPALPGAGEDNAQGVFLTWLSGLHGWLAETPIEIPFDGPLDPATVTDETVRLYRIDADGAHTAQSCQVIYAPNEEAGTSRIVVLPAERPQAGARYGVVVTKEINDAAGMGIMEPLAMYFAASRTPLGTVGPLKDDPQTAASLEIKRQLIAPLLTKAEEEGIDRDQVAMAFTWTISPDPFANFDPGFDPADEDATPGPLDQCWGGRAPAIPLPNTLALDADGTFPAAGTCHAGESSAQGDFDTYLAGLNGWPAVTPITLPLTGPVDMDTIGADDVQLWGLGAEGPARVENVTVTLLTEQVDRCSGASQPGYSLQLVPGTMLDSNTTYIAFATRNIASEAGHNLVPTIPVLMAMQPHDVIDGEGKSLVGNLSDDQAQGIAGLRQIIQPLMQAVEASTDLTHTDLASIWTWFTWKDTFALFDPTTGQVPIPNAFLMSDGLVNLPIGEDSSDLQKAIFAELNTRVGFSVSAPGWIPFDGKLDEESIDHDTIVLASVVGAAPTILTEDDYRIDYHEDFEHVTFTPVHPFETMKLHAGIVTTSLRGANGRPVQPTPAFVFLRTQHSLVDGDGKSLVDVLDDATARELDSARQTYALLFFAAGQIPDRNYRRSEIALAWAFDTGTSTLPLQEYRAMSVSLLDERAMVAAGPACLRLENCHEDPYLELDIADDYADPNHDTLTVDMSNVGAIQRAGEFMTTLFLDFESGRMVGFDDVVDSPVGISAFLPRTEQTDG
ncbi:MAG: hypothetical protein ACNA8W_11045, partial [Bradymonadaceae bacterium]